MIKPLPPQTLLRELLDYDPETGSLTWKERDRRHFTTDRSCKTWNTRFAGDEAFNSRTAAGYLRGPLQGNYFLKHRVIWKWVIGENPDQIDHENGVGTDNHWTNLRDVSGQINMENKRIYESNLSGYSGINRHKTNNRWQVSIGTKYVGSFPCFFQAVKARRAAETDHGYHPNHGRAL